jgi:chemotaxis protein methyltransferase CheR
MYLTPEKISLAAQKFFNTLNEDGWFVVSSCELSSEVFPQFRAVNFPGAIFYKKRKDVFFNPSKSDTGIAMIPSENPGIHPDSFDISQIEFSIDREKHAPIEKPLLAEISPLYAPTPETEINTPDAVAVIRQLADKGMLSDALTQCNTAIDANKMAIGLYYLRASILQELGHSPEAIASLKQSVYIDHNFIMGHFTLASILIKQGHYKQATRYFQNVLELTKDLSGTDILPESDGLSALHIREIILTNMPKISTA